ncbi:MAG: homoserine kinase [Planctomycetota bacterium]|jgi:homoserine kinase
MSRRARTATASAPPTTANLGPGYDVLGLALASPQVPRDVVTVARAARWTAEVAGPEAAGLPGDPDRNVAVRAARALSRAPLHVVVWKGVPPGRGLGSSGASAAAAARATAALLGGRCDDARLLAAAAEGERAATGAAHADNVAPALFGGLICAPTGTTAAPFRYPVPRHVRCAIAIPEVRNTTRAMRKLVPAHWRRADHVREMGAAAAVAACLTRGELARLGEIMPGSLVEGRRAAHIPGYDAVTSAARRAGAAAVTVSGSGPTVVAWCDGRGVAARAATAGTGRGALLRRNR